MEEDIKRLIGLLCLSSTQVTAQYIDAVFDIVERYGDAAQIEWLGHRYLGRPINHPNCRCAIEYSDNGTGSDKWWRELYNVNFDGE